MNREGGTCACRAMLAIDKKGSKRDVGHAGINAESVMVSHGTNKLAMAHSHWKLATTCIFGVAAEQHVALSL